MNPPYVLMLVSKHIGVRNFDTSKIIICSIEMDMKSLYNLKYETLNLRNLNIAFKIQKDIWLNDPDYEDLYDKAINNKDDNYFFLVYDSDVLIGIIYNLMGIFTKRLGILNKIY